MKFSRQFGYHIEDFNCRFTVVRLRGISADTASHLFRDYYRQRYPKEQVDIRPLALYQPSGDDKVTLVTASDPTCRERIQKLFDLEEELYLFVEGELAETPIMPNYEVVIELTTTGLKVEICEEDDGYKVKKTVEYTEN